MNKSNLIDKGTYYRTIQLLLSYKDLKHSSILNGVDSDVKVMIDRGISLLEDEPYINIIKRYYFEGITMEVIANDMNIHVSVAYRNRRRLLKRLSIIFFGDQSINK